MMIRGIHKRMKKKVTIKLKNLHNHNRHQKKNKEDKSVLNLLETFSRMMESLNKLLN